MRDPDPASLEEEGSALAEIPPESGASGREILVVDDNPSNLVAVEAALAPLGRPLVTARSGTEALVHLLERDVALILLDIQMPSLDGYDTARLIRSRERSRHIPIIFLTAYSRNEVEILHGYRLGAVDFLFKPIHPEVLRAKASVFVALQDRTDELVRKAEELREMAQQRRIAEELAAANARLAEADRRKDEFLAILAHELRNPLAPIRLAVDRIRRRPELPVPERITGVLARQVGHLTRLVDDLLDVARITAGKIELRCAPTDLAEIVEQAAVTCQPLIAERAHALALAGPAAAACVDGDAVRLIQVVANLLTNAARYTPPGGRIEAAWGRDGADAFVRVTDSGRGIAPELVDRVFDLFVQDRAGSDGAGGLGLGLNLVRRIVELHGGRVTAASDGLGHGATFELRLPATDRPPAAAPIDVDAAGGAELPPCDPARALRAVIVDDQDDLRELVAELLASWGHHVETAGDGPSGLALIRDHRPDVALVDIGLPGMDGYAVARALRDALPGAPLKLIAMTGYGQAADRDRARAAGFDLHLTKPASPEDLRRALEGDRT